MNKFSRIFYKHFFANFRKTIINIKKRQTRRQIDKTDAGWMGKGERCNTGCPNVFFLMQLQVHNSVYGGHFVTQHIEYFIPLIEMILCYSSLISLNIDVYVQLKF